MSNKRIAHEKMNDDFIKVVKIINEEFGDGYASKNPALVQHLLGVIQEYENRRERAGL